MNLTQLAGSWQGDRGMDVSPHPNGKEENSFSESIIFEPIGSVKNAKSQALAALHYHKIVNRPSNKVVPVRMASDSKLVGPV